MILDALGTTTCPCTLVLYSKLYDQVALKLIKISPIRITPVFAFQHILQEQYTFNCMIINFCFRWLRLWWWWYRWQWMMMHWWWWWCRIWWWCWSNPPGRPFTSATGSSRCHQVQDFQPGHILTFTSNLVIFFTFAFNLVIILHLLSAWLYINFYFQPGYIY